MSRDGVHRVRVRVTSDPSRGVEAADVGGSVPVRFLHLLLDGVGYQAVGFLA